MDRQSSLLAALFTLVLIGCTHAQTQPVKYLSPSAAALAEIQRQSDEWFKSDAGQRALDNIVSWQNENGGWWKTYDPRIPRPAELPPDNPNAGPTGDNENDWRRTSTFDNNATTTEMRLLARAYRVTVRENYKQSFERGLNFVFDSQYASGGWPQRFPLENNYGRHITFNDNLMINVMTLVRDAWRGQGDFAFVSPEDRKRAADAFKRGIDCILRCQVKSAGKLTAWCQQHDAKTFEPVGARAYELPSISGSESAGVVLLLMDVEKPSDAIRTAIDSAAAWYDSSKIPGLRYEKVMGRQYEFGVQRTLIKDPSAPPLWARYYELETNRPFFSNRDGIKVYSLEEVAPERRARYSWYGNWGAPVLARYAQWKKHAPATETAAITVRPGESVQKAIDSIEPGAGPQLILMKPGIYKERITVPKNKPHVTFKGDTTDPSKVVLTYDLNANSVLPGTTQPVGTSGSPSISIEANEFTAEHITFENSAGDKGQAVALKVTGDRCVFRNCRMLGWQDTLYVDNGRQYFDRCYIEGRVDFIFGGSTTVFDHCTIHSKNGGYLTAARTPPERPYGFVFLDCNLSGEGAPAYLGRPWQWDRGRKAHVAFIRTKMGSHIRPEGWNPWDRPNSPNTNPAQTTRYFEFESTDASGKPLDISKRVEWSHQLSKDEAQDYTVEKILAGSDNWNPSISQGVSK